MQGTPWTYCRYCEEHDNELLLRQDGVSNQRVCESCQAFSSFLKKARIGGYRVAID